ncbi:hypothetical protein ACU4GD_37280 [Cupriavidus basilensis]
MRGSHRPHIEALAIGRLAAMETLAIPGRHAALLIGAQVGPQALERSHAIPLRIAAPAVQAPAIAAVLLGIARGAVFLGLGDFGGLGRLGSPRRGGGGHALLRLVARRDRTGGKRQRARGVHAQADDPPGAGKGRCNQRIAGV